MDIRLLDEWLDQMRSVELTDAEGEHVIEVMRTRIRRPSHTPNDSERGDQAVRHKGREKSGGGDEPSGTVSPHHEVTRDLPE